MSGSLFGKLKGLLSRNKKSELRGINLAQPSASTNRIALATGHAMPQPEDLSAMAQAMHQAMPQVPSGLSATPAAGEVGAVAVQFHAEVPTEAGAQEIVTISRNTTDCVTADAIAFGDGFRVSVTLSMLPEPQRIHTVESVLDAWAKKLGGKAAGWGLQQAQAAA